MKTKTTLIILCSLLLKQVSTAQSFSLTCDADSSYYYQFMTTTNTWDTIRKTINMYNYNRNITLQESKYRSAGNAPWVNNVRKAWDYDSFGNPSTYTVSFWNTSVNGWQSNYRHTYNYSGLLRTYELIEWNTSNWFNDSKIAYVYDANNDTLSKTTEVYDYNTLTWTNNNRTTYTVDLNHNITIRIDQLWNTTNSTWKNKERILNTYINNHLSVALLQLWQNSTGQWLNNKKDSLTYDTANNLTGRKSMTWTSLGWKNQSNMIATYDSYHNKLTTDLESWVNPIWKKYSGYIYFYNCSKPFSPVGIAKEEAQKNVSVFPNPAGSTLFIETTMPVKSIRLTNSAGQTVLLSEQAGAISVSQLTPGIYFLLVKDEYGKETFYKKIVKE